MPLRKMITWRSRHHARLLFAAQFLAHAGVFVLLFTISLSEVIVALMGYALVFGFGTSLIYHRLLSHRSWSLPQAGRIAGLFCGTLALQGSSLEWVAVHRDHHRFADTERDPHGPLQVGAWRSYLGSMWVAPRLRTYPEGLADSAQVFFHRYYWTVNIGFSLLLLIVGGWRLMVAAHWAPAALAWQAVAVPKVLCHRQGKARNMSWLAPVTFGESLHLNHHQRPQAFDFKIRPLEFDPGAWIIRVYQRLACVSR